MSNISKLSDYPAIKKLAAALHQFDANQHGAAIMIGAGFSRSAAHHVSGEKKMPLWNDFCKRLLKELNPNDEDLSFSDPLRVAEEYRAYFGQAALNDRIRSEIDNDAWITGKLYQRLLELPWSEIMTTNWDTLLETAAKDVFGPFYTTVTKPSDLTWASSPRIVKLHGSIGMTETFIVAQEDYRTYPQKFAPFVNFARQVFIENELCLLGFSGDDPNFLHWSGWVRDHLAGHARKIYLVGALNLTAARRKHLESLNIAPIDLWDTVQDVDDREFKHFKASELFLQAMIDEGQSRSEPHNWMPKNLHPTQVTEDDFTRQHQDPAYAATLLKSQLEILQKDRESYPGWLVCPPDLSRRVKNQISSPYPNPKNIAALAFNDRAKLLYEIAWRYSIAFEYIPPWLAEAFFQVTNPDEPCGLSKRQQVEIALILLKNSRWLNANDEAGKQAIQEHINALTTLLEKHAQYLPDCAAELAYHKALVTRDELNYVSLEALLEKIEGEDAVWKLRQAALMMELRRFDEGEKLIAKAYGRLRENHRRDRYSIPIVSRLLWAHWLLNAVHSGNFEQPLEELPSFVENNYRKWKCDPWTWLENIQDKARDRQEEHQKNQNPIEPLFAQGHYRDNTRQRSSSNVASEFFLFNELSSHIGIPLRSGSAFMNVNLLAGTAEKLLLAGGTSVELWDYTLAIRAASSESSESITGVFTRIGVARTSQAVVDTLVPRILPAIGYWREKRNHGTTEQKGSALSALRVLIEVLARLVVRVPTEKAKQIFQLAVSIGQQQNLQHHWLFDVIDSLLTHSLNSIPESEQGELLANALAFPLQSEVSNSNFPHWPNPVIRKAPSKREDDSKISDRIQTLIELVTERESIQPSGTQALERLIYLHTSHYLTPTESDELAKKIWGSQSRSGLPNTGLRPHALLFLPALDAEHSKTLVRQYLYEHDEEVLTDTQKELRTSPSPEIRHAVDTYIGMAYAANDKTTRLLPTPEQALVLFNRLMVWRPQIEQDDLLGMFTSARSQLKESIGNALSSAIVPALATVEKTVKRFEQLKMFYEQVEVVFSVIPALIYFVSVNDEIAATVGKIVRKSLQGCDEPEVAYAAFALQKWVELPEAANSILLNDLISRLLVIIESGRTVGLQHLFQLAGELFKNQRLSEDQVATLIEAISNAFDAADYANIEPNSREAVNASSIREACVKLANTLINQNQNVPVLRELLEKAKTDPLPEVRFAIESP